MTEKEKMLHDANDLKSYQMIWLGQRIFVMTTTNFAHLMKKESQNRRKSCWSKSKEHCDEICQG